MAFVGTALLVGWPTKMGSFRHFSLQVRAIKRLCDRTGLNTQESKQLSRCNAARHGLTTETVIGALEDAEDYKGIRSNHHCRL